MRTAYVTTDVSKRADAQALADFACERFGGLDVLVNNAGIGPIARFDALLTDDWDAMIDVDLKGALYGIAAVLPVFGRQKRGHIVNVLSTAEDPPHDRSLRRDEERDAARDRRCGRSRDRTCG